MPTYAYLPTYVVLCDWLMLYIVFNIRGNQSRVCVCVLKEAIFLLYCIAYIK